MRIAIVGGGISGLTAAYLLCREHDITLFEAGNAPGGHTRTLEVERADGRWAVDTGFIVFNEATYPRFSRLLRELGVASQASEMSFSLSCEQTGLEYRASSFATFFAQRRNLANLRFWRMLIEIARLRRDLPALAQADPGLTLQRYLAERRYSEYFVAQFLVPMGAAIWSADPARFTEFPAFAFARFFRNHRILELQDQHPWLTVQGGSHRYLKPLCHPFRERIRLATPVTEVRREPRGVMLRTPAGAEQFDQVVLAVHSDQAFRLLADPTPAEHEVLAAIPYQENRVVLHTDAAVLPRLRRVWSSWNVRVPRQAQEQVVMTYWMNCLQRLQAPVEFCVTLNQQEGIDPAQVIDETRLAHPRFTPAGFAAQRRWQEVNGVDRTWYCGAWWGYGFHEDGVKSAEAVARALGVAV